MLKLFSGFYSDFLFIYSTLCLPLCVISVKNKNHVIPITYIIFTGGGHLHFVNLKVLPLWLLNKAF